MFLVNEDSGSTSWIDEQSGFSKSSRFDVHVRSHRLGYRGNHDGKIPSAWITALHDDAF